MIYKLMISRVYELDQKNIKDCIIDILHGSGYGKINAREIQEEIYKSKTKSYRGDGIVISLMEVL